jgi:hypothetical protein
LSVPTVWGYPQSTIKTNETLMRKHSKAKKQQTMHLDCVSTRTRPARRNASTDLRLRLVRGTLNGTPRSRHDSYEARSIKCLDYRQTPTRTTPGRIARTILPIYSEAKIRAFNTTTFYRHGYSHDRRGSNTSVSSHFLPPIPGWEVKTCHYTHLTAHCFATDHPRGRIQQGPYPMISGIRPYPSSLDPTSTRPRPTTGQQGRKADVAQDSRSFRRLVPNVTAVSGDGQPFLRHVATATSAGIDKTLPQDTPVSRSPLTL